MRFLFLIQLCFIFCSVTGQTGNYYKQYSSVIGTSAISDASISCKTFSFSKPIYRIVSDSISGSVIISTRLKDASGKSFSNRGFHLFIDKNDSACCTQEDSKFEIGIAGEYLIFSNDSKSGLYNRAYGYDQFEYPSKIIYTISKNKSGLIYNPALKGGQSNVLSCIDLKDGAIRWNADIPAQQNWNEITEYKDSLLVIAAGGLHAANIQKGLAWSHELQTTKQNKSSYLTSPLSRETYDRVFHSISFPANNDKFIETCSNILTVGDTFYFAGSDKLIAVDIGGHLVWQTPLDASQTSKSILREAGENIWLLNTGVSLFNDNLVLTGNPFVKAFDKKTGTQVFENRVDIPSPLNDICVHKNALLLCGKNKVVEITDQLKVNCLSDLASVKFGNFLEFVNGNEYYVEKEGFYVPLNFINDNVIYFKTDHDKVFGMNNNNIEYEYHFTELYRLNKEIGKKKLISQKEKSLLISENFELLETFNCAEKALFHNNRIFFPGKNLLQIIDVANLK